MVDDNISFTDTLAIWLGTFALDSSHSPILIFVQYLSAAMTNLTMPVQKAENASLILGVLIAWR